jgi:polyphosphate kinase
MKALVRTCQTLYEIRSEKMATSVLASIGDHGVLNSTLTEDLSAVWIDRDLSWLDFNERVLAEALDERTPLLERAKFLAIFTSNLDEFSMKRLAVVRQGQTAEQRALYFEIREKLLPALRQQAECYRASLIPKLAENGILLRRWDDLSVAQREEASAYFDNHVSAALTPLVIDPEHPFPFISNLSTSLTFRLQDPLRAEQLVARSGAEAAGSVARGDSRKHREALQRHDDLRHDAGSDYKRCRGRAGRKFRSRDSRAG